MHLLLRTARRLFRAAAPAAVLLCAFPIHAQQPSSFPVQELIAVNNSSSSQPLTPVLAQRPPKSGRLFFPLTHYMTVEKEETFEPLSLQSKFVLSVKTMSDPITVSFIGMGALIGQAQNSNPSYGQGFGGYGKRYGTLLADTGIATVMTTSLFPTVLHQDPRYFQLGTGGVLHRAMYSVSRIVVARADSGQVQFNYSEVVGNVVAAGISNAYHPRNQRTLGNTLSIWGTNMMLNMLCNVAEEFWPDLRRKLHKPKIRSSALSLGAH